MKKVLIISGNGFAGLLNSDTCPPDLLRIIAETFSPLSVDGQQFSKLTELRSFIRKERGLPETVSPKTQGLTKVTHLNGIVLYNYLKRNGFDPILINDLTEDETDLNKSLEEDLLAVAVSTTFLPFKSNLSPIIERIRDQRLTVPIIVGGPMVYMSYVLFNEKENKYDREVLKKLYLFFEPEPNINYYIIDRHGLKTMCSLLDAIDGKKDVGLVPNLAVMETNRIRFSSVCPETPDIMDEVIDWDLIPDESLNYTVSVRGSMGCPFKCKFCNFHFFAPKMSTKPIQLLLSELDQLVARPSVKHISFADDNFFFTPQKVEQFCQYAVKRNYPFTWSSFIRADTLNRDNIDLVADSGAKLLTFGVESGDKTIISNMDKRVKLSHTVEVVNALAEKNIPTSSTFIVGFPGETKETVSHSIDLLNQYRNSGTVTHWISPFVFMMMPKVRIESERQKYQLNGFMLDWSHQTMDVMEAARQLKRLMFLWLRSFS